MVETPRGFENGKSSSDFFKMAEMLTLMIAAGSVGHFMTAHPSLDNENKVKMYLWFVMIAILVAVLSYLIFLVVNSTSVNHAFGPTKKASIVFAIMAGLLLVGSALLANFSSKQSFWLLFFLHVCHRCILPLKVVKYRPTTDQMNNYICLTAYKYESNRVVPFQMQHNSITRYSHTNDRIKYLDCV
ncbi:uncharacterized protein LOC114516530 isoform X2 [Dendronephthya gigantea]|nr:uncharacterized protein LOC114516530 isoform X2 [Dendronephthya gigantea]